MRSGTFWSTYRTPTCSGNYIRFGLRIETGAERLFKESLNASKPSEHLPDRGDIKRMIGAQPEKATLYGGQSRSWSAILLGTTVVSILTYIPELNMQGLG